MFSLKKEANVPTVMVPGLVRLKFGLFRTNENSLAAMWEGSHGKFLERLVCCMVGALRKYWSGGGRTERADLPLGVLKTHPK